MSKRSAKVCHSVLDAGDAGSSYLTGILSGGDVAGGHGRFGGAGIGCDCTVSGWDQLVADQRSAFYAPGDVRQAQRTAILHDGLINQAGVVAGKSGIVLSGGDGIAAALIACRLCLDGAVIQRECTPGVPIVEFDGGLQCLQDIFQILACCGDRYNLFMKRLFVEGLLLLGHVAVSIQVPVMFEVLFQEITGVLIRK